jgi:hypothetical protein
MDGRQRRAGVLDKTPPRPLPCGGAGGRFGERGNKITQYDFGEEAIDRVRDRMYEEIKDMSISEISAYFDKKAAPIIKRFNMSVVQPAARV